MVHSLAARAGVEMLGSLMTYTLAVGSLANALLPRTKGEGMGLLAIASAVGLGIGLPIAMFYRVSAFFNPAILLAQAVRGLVPGGAGAVWALLAAELAGYFAGAWVLFALYLPHLNAAVQLPAADEVDRLLRDPATLNRTALLNASYNLGAPSVTTLHSFWRFAAADLRRELRVAAAARRVADPFRTCPEEIAQACEMGERAGSCGSRSGKPGPRRRSKADGDAEAGAVPPPAADASCASDSGDDAGSEGSGAAPTYAARLRAGGHGGGAGAAAADARGQLAGALCKARQDVLLSVFVTRPAVWSPFLNLAQEFIATTIMATAALLLVEQGALLAPPAAELWPPLSGLLIGLLNTACILSLGGPTGPAMNPARDLGPRCAFHLLPIPGKGCAEWHYGWVPVVGGMAGGAAAGGFVAAISLLL